MYIYMCVCVCVCIYMYIFIYIYTCMDFTVIDCCCCSTCIRVGQIKLDLIELGEMRCNSKLNSKLS